MSKYDLYKAAGQEVKVRYEEDDSGYVSIDDLLVTLEILKIQTGKEVALEKFHDLLRQIHHDHGTGYIQENCGTAEPPESRHKFERTTL